MQHRRSWAGLGLALLAWSAGTGANDLVAQQQWLNSPLPTSGRPIFPFFEGWYDNGDGTFTLSFGYLNRNPNDIVEIPHGDRNYIEPAEFNGQQPTTFSPSRNRGVFAVTIPASMRDEDIWWYITDDDGTVYKVPGRTRSSGYQLDWVPRPHGSLPPLLWFTSEQDAFRGPEGSFAPTSLTASVGRPVTLSVSARDLSQRDPQDPRFREPVAVTVTWSKYQGPPGGVTFTRHDSNPVPPPAAGGRGQVGGRGQAAPRPEVIRLAGGQGTAQVIATFPAPGDYIMRAQADNFDSPDSTPGDQCCWTNAYVRVSVAP